MNNQTIIIVGPSGSGKSHLAQALKPEVGSLDPWRLRPEGPRPGEKLYAPPDLKDRLKERADFESYSDLVEWSESLRTFILNVRGTWQVYLCPVHFPKKMKIEFFGPLLPECLEILHEDIGEITVLILNPSKTCLTEQRNLDWNPLKEATQKNLLARQQVTRASVAPDIQKRIDSLDEEAPSWLRLLNTHNGEELVNWPFTEHHMISRRYTLTDVINYLRKHAPTVANKFFRPAE